jgi:ubiquinone/menaquinone biosynthesis C-methylase UbiE
MALNYDGIFDEEGYLTPAKEISSLINVNTTTDILELGCGKGFNSIFLAKRFPDIQFQGVDITHEHLLTANRKAQRIDNAVFSYGDFHHLEFRNGSFDIVYELESICHALDQKKVLQGVYDKLKQNGVFVLYEGFRMNDFEELSDEIKKAARLTEKSMAVNRSLEVGEWLKIATEIGFKIRVCENISEAIMPNLGKFQKLSRGYFKYPFLSRLFLVFLPRDMIMNSIAGLLMPFTIRHRAQGYFKIILSK